MYNAQIIKQRIIERAKYGGDLERNWNAMLVCAAMVKREETLR